MVVEERGPAEDQELRRWRVVEGQEEPTSGGGQEARLVEEDRDPATVDREGRATEMVVLGEGRRNEEERGSR